MEHNVHTKGANMPEIAFEIRGSGFVPGYPGEYANCRAVFDEDTRQLLRVEPLTALEEAPTEQPTEEANQGG